MLNIEKISDLWYKYKKETFKKLNFYNYACTY